VLRRSDLTRLLLVPLAVMLFLLAGCGQAFVGFFSNPGNPMRVSGIVSTVQLAFINDGHGTSVTFTAVTFSNAGTVTTINFCGDQRRVFPIDRSAEAGFATGVFCSTLITLTIL
jgi:hypothetical protein